MDAKQIVHTDPEILGGTPVFIGTRVPVHALIDFLEGGDTIEDFLENYPGVSREQQRASDDGAGRWAAGIYWVEPGHFPAAESSAGAHNAGQPFGWSSP